MRLNMTFCFVYSLVFSLFIDMYNKDIGTMYLILGAFLLVIMLSAVDKESKNTFIPKIALLSKELDTSYIYSRVIFLGYSLLMIMMCFLFLFKPVEVVSCNSKLQLVGIKVYSQWAVQALLAPTCLTGVLLEIIFLRYKKVYLKNIGYSGLSVQGLVLPLVITSILGIMFTSGLLRLSLLVNMVSMLCILVTSDKRASNEFAKSISLATFVGLFVGLIFLFLIIGSENLYLYLIFGVSIFHLYIRCPELILRWSMAYSLLFFISGLSWVLVSVTDPDNMVCSMLLGVFLCRILWVYDRVPHLYLAKERGFIENLALFVLKVVRGLVLRPFQLFIVIPLFIGPLIGNTFKGDLLCPKVLGCRILLLVLTLCCSQSELICKFCVKLLRNTTVKGGRLNKLYLNPGLSFFQKVFTGVSAILPGAATLSLGGLVANEWFTGYKSNEILTANGDEVKLMRKNGVSEEIIAKTKQDGQDAAKSLTENQKQLVENSVLNTLMKAAGWPIVTVDGETESKTPEIVSKQNIRIKVGESTPPNRVPYDAKAGVKTAWQIVMPEKK